jgi:plastocyanin
MPDWLIEIVSVTPTEPGGPTAAFKPATQQVLVGDNITWTNRTDDPHQPVPVSPKPPSWPAAFGVNEVPPDQSSNPTYSVVAPVQLDSNGQPVLVNGKTVPVYGPATYQCKNHPNETGTFDVIKVPPTF